MTNRDMSDPDTPNMGFSFVDTILGPPPDVWKVRMDFEPSEREEDDDKDSDKSEETNENFQPDDSTESETSQLTGDSKEEYPRVETERRQGEVWNKTQVARRRSSQTMKKSVDIEKQITDRKNIDPVNNYKGYVKLCLCGISLIVFGYAIYIANPLLLTKTIMLSLKEGSYLMNFWEAPPIKLYIKAYLFNVTNSERFMRGLDKKLRVSEIGPYVYSESLENTNVTWNDNDTISFTPRRRMTFVPELSAGDPNDSYLIAPNVPMLGISSMLHNSSFGINMAMMTVINYFKAKPLMTMSVQEFLWGYDDPLVEFASRVLPSWISFRRFGLLERMTNEGENRVTISTKLTNETVPFTIQQFNGRDTMKQWTYGDSINSSRCNSLKGALEGLLLPQNLDTSISVAVYRKAFCRTLPMVFVNETTSEKGFPTYLYTLREDAMDPDSPDNDCFCRPNMEPCLPNGLSDMSPCYYGIPVAMSLPHFLKADESLLEKSVDGLSPDESKHSTLVGIQPDSGVPLYMTSRLQMNLIMKKVKYISKVKQFNDMIIPIIWLQVELEELPSYINLLLNMLLITGPILQRSIIGLLFLSGLGMLLAASLRYVWQSGIFRHAPTATMISYNKKNPHEDRTIWPAQYTQLIPIPINPLTAARSR